MGNNVSIYISVKTRYLDEQSSAQDSRHAFAYTVTISNKGSEAVRLLSRHWVITDANEQVQEVQGEGVVGEQPLIEAGKSFSYTSGTMLETTGGTMHGSYTMCNLSGDNFDAPIELFSLVRPSALH
jgi:ApaG protein